MGHVHDVDPYFSDFKHRSYRLPKIKTPEKMAKIPTFWLSRPNEHTDIFITTLNRKVSERPFYVCIKLKNPLGGS